MASRRWFLFFALISCAVKVSTATLCYNDGGWIQTADLSALITDVQENNINPPAANPFYLGAQASADFAYQTCMICVQNYDPFGGAGVSLAEVTDGASVIQSVCCSGACQGGETTITPDYGPQILLTLHSSDYDCSLSR